MGTHIFGSSDGHQYAPSNGLSGGPSNGFLLGDPPPSNLPPGEFPLVVDVKLPFLVVGVASFHHGKVVSW